jgi:two-component system chemotaxis response regulator CheY
VPRDGAPDGRQALLAGAIWSCAMKTCLIVDDSRVVRLLARRILEDLAFEIREAEDGFAALDACRQAMPDAILLDWNMPGMTGLEFLKKLRTTADGNRPVVVFCTTENDLQHIQEALAAGADEYIMKPFDSQIIESKFEQVGLI